jgi:hypothetical protein
MLDKYVALILHSIWADVYDEHPRTTSRMAGHVGFWEELGGAVQLYLNYYSFDLAGSDFHNRETNIFKRAFDNSELESGRYYDDDGNCVGRQCLLVLHSAIGCQ